MTEAERIVLRFRPTTVPEAIEQYTDAYVESLVSAGIGTDEELLPRRYRMRAVFMDIWRTAGLAALAEVAEQLRALGLDVTVEGDSPPEGDARPESRG